MSASRSAVRGSLRRFVVVVRGCFFLVQRAHPNQPPRLRLKGFVPRRVFAGYGGRASRTEGRYSGRGQGFFVKSRPATLAKAFAFDFLLLLPSPACSIETAETTTAHVDPSSSLPTRRCIPLLTLTSLAF